MRARGIDQSLRFVDCVVRSSNRKLRSVCIAVFRMWRRTVYLNRTSILDEPNGSSSFLQFIHLDISHGVWVWY